MSSEVKERRFNDFETEETPFDVVDFAKLKGIALKNLPLIILILLACLTISFLSIRYTRPLYQAVSTLQIEKKSDAKVLGFKSFDEDINELAREIEIIKSRLFLNKVAEVLNWQVSYYQYGDILFEERFPFSPFKVQVLHCPAEAFDKPIDLTILNANKIAIEYKGTDGSLHHSESVFGDTIKLENLRIIVISTSKYNEVTDNRYFFTINSPASQVNFLDANLNVQPLDFKAQTITVSFNDYNREKANVVVNAIDTLYIYYSQLEQNKSNTQRIDFLNLQMKQTEEKLSELEEYFENFTISNKTTNLDNNLTRTISMLEALDSQRFVIQRKIDLSNSLFDKVVKESEFDLNPAEMVAFSDDLSAELQRLSNLYEEKRSMLGSYNENTFAYQKKNQEIDFLKNRLAGYLESSRADLYASLDRIKQNKSRLEAEFVSLPGKRTEYTKTERYYSLYEEFYLSLIKSKAEFELAQAGSVTNFRILSSAFSPAKPISPNKIIYYTIGIMAGVIISFMLISMGYLLHNKITSQHEIERISSAFVLGAIPTYSKKDIKNTRLIVNNNLKSEISEAFRSIRTNLEFLNGHHDKIVIAITSTISGEGKTFVATNLGGIISLLDRKVLLIDLDMRKPRFQEVFSHATTAKGLSTILINKHTIEECIQESVLPNLHFISAGPIPPNPSELILGGAFDTLIDNAKKLYDVIIIDTPPVGLVTDGIYALKIATIPIYVFRANYSKKAFLKNVNRLTKVNKIKTLSLILNSIKKASEGSYSYGKNYYEEEKLKPKSRLRKLLHL